MFNDFRASVRNTEGLAIDFLTTRRNAFLIVATATLGVIAVVVATLLLYHGEFTNIVYAADYSNGPITTDDSADSCGTDHSSTVDYDKETNPFVATVERVHYGGRKPDGGFWGSLEQWRREPTKYWEWDGEEWVLEATVVASSWLSTGGCPGLDWDDFYNEVEMEGGAAVVQYLTFKYYNTFGGGDWIEWPGSGHTHFLE